MRKLVFILIAFIAVVTFIRAFDNSGSADGLSGDIVNGLSGDIGIIEAAINFNQDY
jgi:hypothetical protein